MKKMMIGIMLGVSVIFGGMTSTALAEDIYVATHKDADLYVDSDSVLGYTDEFTCTAKSVDHADGKVRIAHFGFVARNGMVMCGERNGQGWIVTPSTQPALWALYKTALRYLRPLTPQ